MKLLVKVDKDRFDTPNSLRGLAIKISASPGRAIVGPHRFHKGVEVTYLRIGKSLTLKGVSLVYHSDNKVI